MKKTIASIDEFLDRICNSNFEDLHDDEKRIKIDVINMQEVDQSLFTSLKKYLLKHSITTLDEVMIIAKIFGNKKKQVSSLFLNDLEKSGLEKLLAKDLIKQERQKISIKQK